MDTGGGGDMGESHILFDLDQGFNQGYTQEQVGIQVHFS